MVARRRAQTVLLSSQGMRVAKIVEVSFTGADRVREVIHDFNTDGFDSLDPKCKGGRPKASTLSERRGINWHTSRDPDYAAEKARVKHLYAIADGEVIPEDGEPELVFRTGELGPFNLMPHPGRQRAEHGGRHKEPDRGPRHRRRTGAPPRYRTRADHAPAHAVLRHGRPQTHVLLPLFREAAP
ncbi:hypothetical protein SUDANB15_07163 [Streptomyces sp. enrichment culture]